MPGASDGFASRLFGLTVRSSVPIPFAIPVDPAQPADLTIHCAAAPDLPLAHTLAYPDETRFTIDAAGSNVWLEWPSPLTFEDVCTYLLGPVFALLLRLSGLACLHAAAVEIDGEAVLFPGTSGGGKSTLAAALVQRGYRLIAEDVTPIVDRSGVLYAVPTYPGIRLWPTSVELLFGSRDALPHISASWDKRMFDARDRFADREIPVGAIVFPEAALPDAATRMSAIDRAETAMHLIGHSYHAEQCDAAMRRREFETFSRLASEVRARALVVGSGAHEIQRACDLVLGESGVTRHV